MATGEVPASVLVGQAVSVKTECGAEGAEPLMAGSASEEKDTQASAEAPAALADEVSLETPSDEAAGTSEKDSASCPFEAETSIRGSTALLHTWSPRSLSGQRRPVWEILVSPYRRSRRSRLPATLPAVLLWCPVLKHRR